MGGPWFVAFLPRGGLRASAWWARLLHPGYRHVLACRAAAPAATLLVDHRGSRLAAEVVPVPIGPFVRGLTEAAGAWVLAWEEAPPADRAALRGPATCVEAVKSALGVHAPHILTPRQLARHLRSRGARPVLPIPGTETPPWVA